MRKPIAALVLAAGLGVASFTGCTSNASTEPTETAQSTADACQIASEYVQEFQDDMSTTMSEAAAGDFSKIVEVMNSLKTRLGEAADEVSNTEVKDALNEFGDSMDKFAKVFEGVANGDLTVMTAKSAEIQEATEAMQTAGQKLSDTCTL